MIDIVDADLLNPCHGAAIVRLLNEYAQDDMGGNCELSHFVKQNLVTELRKRHGVYVILAYYDDHPAGLSICFEGFSTFACKPLLNIHDFMVSKKYRGLGISKQLLSKAEAIARSLGCCKLTLEVLEGNMIAQAAYKSCGYTYYQLDPKAGKALFWQKVLDSGNWSLEDCG
jgi:GNAT superfamily N-acetyltransferase